MSERTSALTKEQIREMFDNCMRRLDDYHFAQCARKPRCTCHLAIVKDAILANFNAMHNAGIAAERERAALACIALGDARVERWKDHPDMLEDAMALAWWGMQCAAAIRAGDA